MSGFPLNSVRDAQRFRNAYLGTLSLQQEINTKNFNANALYKRTGVVPTEISDYRSTSEKLADIARLRIAVRGQLREIADSSNAEDIAQNMTSDQVQFVAQNIDALIKVLKPKYKLGIVKDIFIPYLVKYMNDEMENRIAKAGLSTKVSAEPDLLLDLPTGNEVPNELMRKMDIYTKILTINQNIRQNIEGQSNETAILTELEGILGSLPPPQSLADEVQALQTLPLDEKRMGTNKIIRDLDSVDEVFENLTRFYERIAVRQGSVSTPISGSKGLVAGELPRPDDNENEQLPLLAGKDEYYPTVPLEHSSKAQLKEYINRYIDLSPYDDKDLKAPTLKAVTFFIRNKELTPSLIKGMSNEHIQLYQRITTKTPATPSSQASMGSLFGSPSPIESPIESPAKGNGMRGRGVGQSDMYAQLGRYHIVLPKLRDDIVAIHNTQFKALPGFKPQRVSVDVGNVLRKIVGGGTPSFEDLSKLNENDKSVLDHIVRVTRMAVELPRPSNDKEDVNQFNIMKGEISCGNDSAEMIKKFKLLILKLAHNGRLPKGQCKDLLIELAHLGY